MPWPTACTEPYWTIHADEWETARERIGRLSVVCHRQAFTALVDHMQAGWEVMGALQVEADRIIHSGRRASSAARDVAGFLECDPTDNYRYIVQMCLGAIPGGRKPWIDELGDVDGEAEEIVRHVRVLYMASAHPEFPPLLGAALQDAYPRMVEWFKKLPSLLRPIERLAIRETRGEPLPMH